MNVHPALISFMFCCSVLFYIFNLNFFFQKAGTSADYSMDLHHKEQLHDNVSMMQAQHYSVSFNFCCGERKNENKHTKLFSLHRFDQGIGLVQNSFNGSTLHAFLWLFKLFNISNSLFNLDKNLLSLSTLPDLI